MTQRIRAEKIMDVIELPNEEQLVALDEILGEAQNRPPDGAADGSIRPVAWVALKGFIIGLRDAHRCRTVFNGARGHESERFIKEVKP